MHKKTTFTSKFIYLISFFVLSTLFTQCSKDDPVDKVIEEPTIFNISAGDYVGLWNSTTPSVTFTNLAVSAKIVDLSNGNFGGTLYINNDLSGNGAGNIEFKIVDNTISDYVWDDTILNCEGTFTGGGKLTTNNAIVINFTGTDCDGNHAGNMTLKKQ